MTLLQLANEAIEPHLDAGVRVEAVVAGPPGMRPPEIRRMPEVLHAMTSFVENAVDFARSEVLVSVRFDEDSVLVEVRDDGPGFSPDVLAKLGEPYVTSRPGAEGSRSGHVGMGLGFFIAKTLLERTGARVDFRNAGGALVSARGRGPRSRRRRRPVDLNTASTIARQLQAIGLEVPSTPRHHAADRLRQLALVVRMQHAGLVERRRWPERQEPAGARRRRAVPHATGPGAGGARVRARTAGGFDRRGDGHHQSRAARLRRPRHAAWRRQRAAGGGSDPAAPGRTRG